MCGLELVWLTKFVLEELAWDVVHPPTRDIHYSAAALLDPAQWCSSCLPPLIPATLALTVDPRTLQRCVGHTADVRVGVIVTKQHTFNALS